MSEKVKSPNNGETNGLNRWPSEIDVAANPYISSGPAKDTGQDEGVGEEERSEPATERRRNPRRRVMAWVVAILSAVCIALGLYAFYGGRKEVNYQIAEKKRQKVAPQSATGLEDGEPNQMTSEAINQAKEAWRKSDPSPGLSPSPGAQPDAKQQTGATPTWTTPYIVPDTPAASAKGTSAGTSARGADQSGVEATGKGSTRNANSYSNGSPAQTHSIYVSGPPDAARRNVTSTRPGSSAPNLERARAFERSKEVTLPSFGAMLPVRTLGAIYTLRQGSLARLELTREVSGEGWRLQRGTVMVAKLEGNENDRAFLSLIGFIDPTTNGFIRLSGDVLGGDGAPGLRGKKRRVNSRWGSVFNRVANSAVSLSQAALAHGNSTTIVMPSGINSDFGLSPNTISRREFVEVSAGMPAYVMVTDLPKQAKGVDAEPADLPADLEEGEALTDEELARLLSEGMPEQIRAALPRMSPEMKKIAQIVLGEKR
jgi:hypothetical protein